MAGHVKASLADFAVCLKKPYVELIHSSEHNCPNCSKSIDIEYQYDSLKQLYYVRVKCRPCLFTAVSCISNEILQYRTFDILIFEVVTKLVSVDLIAETERELERELELESVEDDIVPF